MNEAMSAVRFHRFLIPKRGSRQNECEDAIAINRERMVFAIGDGATEAYDSRSWARLFVKAWARIIPPPLEMQDFEPFVRDLGLRLHRRWSKRKLPWYAEEKAYGGSFLAFLVVKLDFNGKIYVWRASALGDCCLIDRKKGLISKTFPISASKDFGNNPILLPSVESKQKSALSAARYESGSATQGDDLLLLTDAIASWFLRQHETDEEENIELFDKLTASDDESGLLTFLESLRSADKIRNDDVGIVRIEFV